MVRGKITITEAARELGISVDTLRNLERRKAIPPVQRDAISGFRVFDENAIDRIRRTLKQMEDRYAAGNTAWSTHE